MSKEKSNQKTNTDEELSHSLLPVEEFMRTLPAGLKQAMEDIRERLPELSWRRLLDELYFLSAGKGGTLSNFDTFMESGSAKSSGLDSPDLAGSVTDFLELNYLQAAEGNLSEESINAEAANILSSVLDVIPAQIALLDERTHIIFKNAEWKFPAFVAEEDCGNSRGNSLLECCLKAVQHGRKEAVPMVRGLEKIIYGGQEAFRLEYLVTDGESPGWFRLCVSSMLYRDKRYLVLMQMEVTETLQAHEALAGSEKRYHSLLENSEDIIFLLDKEGHFQYGSPALAKVLGFWPVEFMRRAVSEFIHPDDIQGFNQKTEKVLSKAGDSVGVLFQFRHKDGSWRWLEGTLKNQLQEPAVNALICNCRDVTLQRQSSDKLIESEQRYRVLARNFPNGFISIINNEGIIQFAEGLELEAQGIIPSGLTGHHLSTFYGVENFAELWPYYLQAFDGQGSDFDLPILGRVYYCLVVPLPLLEGGKKEVMVISQNISSRINSEKRLRASHHELNAMRAAMDLSALVSITDKRGVITYVNENFCKASGYTSEELIGQTHILLDSGLHEQEYYNEMLRTVQAGLVWKGEVSMRSKQNEIYWTETSIVPQKDEDGNIEKLISLRHDITHRVLAEKEMKEEFLNLQKTNTELDRFVYSTSHDLRAPLASIMGLVKLFHQEQLEPRQEEYLELIERSVNKLNDFIVDIIDYSRNNRLKIREEVIDFVGMVTEIFENHRFIEGAEKIEITLEAEENNFFYSDKYRLKTIFNNLISNAVKYHDHDKPHQFIAIKIRTDSTQAVIEIEDNGSGIDAEHIASIFEMFYRANTKSIGSGLGLYIVKEIVEKLNGVITVESKIGEGTLFRLFVPNNPPSAEPEEEE